MRNPHPPVGIVANPASAWDIRRLVANASTLQVADRANIVQRVLTAVGVPEVLIMPDGGGIGALLRRAAGRPEASASPIWPALGFVDMPMEGTVADRYKLNGFHMRLP